MAEQSNSKSQQFAKNTAASFSPQFVQLATVMDNRDPTRTGKLKIWIQNSQSDSSSKGSWMTASYLSPFAGRTPGTPGAASYSQFPKGYGWWAVPPDVGVTVAVFFANGNIHECYWFACGYDDRMNTMVPGSATQTLPNSGYDMAVPITDYDRNTLQTQMDEKYVNVPLVAGLTKQNLLYDQQKGAANRSGTRQTISNTYGMSSPRGNSFVIDDGYTDAELTAPSWDDDPDSYQNTQIDSPVNNTAVGVRKNEGIVLRTRSGAQFLLSEDQGNVFLINRDGTARFEMTPDGQITVHSDKSITIRTDEDFNLSVAKDMNVEVGGNYNMHVQGASKLNLAGTLDAKVDGQVVINTGADLRLVAAASIRVQSGSSTNISSGENTAITASTTVDITGTSVNITGGGNNLTVKGGSTASSEQISAPDFKTPSIGLADHIHYHAAFASPIDHSNEMAPPVNGGGSANTTTAAAAAPANDVAATTPTVSNQDNVQHINSTTEVGQVLTQDLVSADGTEDNGATYTTTYEGLQLVMPCTGTIREFGYWGKNVPTQSGTTTNRNGWIIQAKGDVFAPEGGLITKMANGGVVITHPIGYKTIIYDITVTANNQDTVTKGQKIGTANGVFEMEIRVTTSNIYGFLGTVDPGLFYSTVTGKGADCANKSLEGGKPSNPNPKPVTGYSPDSSDLVVITTVSTIGSIYSQRGSKHVPKRTKSATAGGGTSTASVPAEDLSSVNKTAEDWKVSTSDSALVAEIKEFEGTIAYQSKVGYYRNGRFWIYKDNLGYPTIGYGHLITASDNFGGGIDEPTADALLQKDFVRTVRDAESIYAKYNMKTPYVAQVVLTEMVFQMGKYKVLGFKNMLTAMAAGNYRVAAAEIRNSRWYTQTKRRAEIMARRLEACQ